MIYQFKSGSHIAGVSPQVAGEAIASLRKRHGHVTPNLLVEANKLKKAPLHDYFFGRSEKDLAAERREELAQHIIMCVIGMETPDSEPRQAFICVSRNADTVGHYTTAEIAFSDPVLCEVVLARARQELAAFKRKYADLKELASLFRVIDEVLEERELISA